MAQGLESALHPDANLISSFVERTVTDRERAKIMKHLEHCRQCRQIVMLATPRVNFDVITRSAALSGARESRLEAFFNWRLLRWGAPAALAIFVLSVFLYRSPEPAMRDTESATEEGTALPSEGKSSDTVVAEKSEATAPIEEFKSKQAEAVTLNAAPGSPTARRRGPARQDLRRKETSGTAAAPAAQESHAAEVASAAGVLSALVRVESAKANRKAAAPGKPRVSPSHVAALQRFRSTASGATAGSETPAAPPIQDSTNGPADKGRNDEPADREALAAGVAGSQPGDTAAQDFHLKTGLEQRRAAGGITNKKNSNRTSRPGLPGLTKTRFTHALQPPKSSARWSIISADSGTANGAPGSGLTVSGVARSLDEGKSWQALHVDDTVTFRAVYAAGASVWAGGSGGALYRSVDGGDHWTRVPFTLETETSSGTVVEIDFSNSEEGKVKTDDGETWTTSDGGRRWAKK